MVTSHHHLSVVNNVDGEDDSSSTCKDEVQQFTAEKDRTDNGAQREDNEDDTEGSTADRKIPFWLESEYRKGDDNCCS